MLKLMPWFVVVASFLMGFSQITFIYADSSLSDAIWMANLP
jgi:hypothetical protein